ncbi:DUF2631 domain-containing protein [Blastococcus goldschmidtiae]|uniref:DUF2631 domain-containing protein n=1 Tax=Blastococcus goldschmidtiae TaxID=3075546 RepID=A0ABU2KAG7_9ACTN|nr:DUF2631 domain-containing protein [Blastococcus sp. DSM 46792]MDT0277184.1 DUF2631 domain-containing protein [Blastococcus sp. DSM 46792]
MSEALHRSRITQDNSATERVNQPGREEGVVRAGAHPVVHEEPADWGWHGETGRWGRRAAWVTVLIVLAYIFGNHEGRVEDLWVLGTAALLAAILVWDIFRRKNAWRSR